MKYTVVLFDLDGTLTDPGEGITNSVMYSLKKIGIEVTDRSTLYRFIGPPLHESFENFFSFSHEQAMEAVGYYREYYAEKGIFRILTNRSAYAIIGSPTISPMQVPFSR